MQDTLRLQYILSEVIFTAGDARVQAHLCGVVVPAATERLAT